MSGIDTKRIISMYAGEPGRLVDNFSKEEYIILITELEAQVSALKGTATPPTGGLLELHIKKIEAERDTARQLYSQAQKDIWALRIGGGKGTGTPLTSTQELFDWTKVDNNITPEMLKKWRTTGHDIYLTHKWLTNGLGIDEFGFARWALAPVSEGGKAGSFIAWQAADGTARTALKNEYGAVNTVDATGFNWADLPTTPPRAFNQAAKNNWTTSGFDFNTTWTWVEAGMKVDDNGFCEWLRDVKGAPFNDPKHFSEKANLPSLNAEYNQWLAVNKVGVIKFTPTDIAFTDASVNRGIALTIAAGSITKQRFTAKHTNRLDIAGWAGATTITLALNTTHATPVPTPDPENVLYGILKAGLTNKKNKGFEINIIDLDKVAVAANNITIPYGSFDMVETAGFSTKPKPLALTAKINGFKAGINARLTAYTLTTANLNAFNAGLHWGDGATRPNNWEDFVNQVMYDEPSATVNADKTDFNFDSVVSGVYAGLAEFVIDWFCGKDSKHITGAPTTANLAQLQQYINQNRNAVELTVYNDAKYKTWIEAAGGTVKTIPTNWGQVLTEIRNYFPTLTNRTLTEIRNKGQELKLKYVDPMKGIDLDGKTKVEKIANITNGTLRKTDSTVAIINGATDHRRVDGANTYDYVSHKERWLNYYTPVETAGGGNCWLHSLNIHLTGLNDGSLITRLRVAACLELMTNKEWIADPLVPNPANEQITANEIRNYLMTRTVAGQPCAMAVEGQWFEGADGNFFSQLLSRPLVLVYTTNGINPYAAGGYHMAYSRHDDKDLTNKFTRAEPWYIFNRNSGHYEAFIQHDNHRDLILTGKTKDVKIDDATNAGDKRAIIFEYTKTNLKEAEFSTETTTKTEIDNLDIKNVEAVVFDFSDKTIKAHFTSQEFRTMASLITDGVDLSVITRKTSEWRITVYDYKKIDTTTITGGLVLKPGEFDIDFIK